jgi:hypothetical protein
VRRTFEQGKNLLLQSSGLTEEAYGILKCVARYPAELVQFFKFSLHLLRQICIFRAKTNGVLMSISELQQLTIAVLVAGLGLICLITTRIIKILRKQIGNFARWGFLILAVPAAFEILRLLVIREPWYDLAWYSSPFLYFWLILLGYSLVQYFKKQKESR